MMYGYPGERLSQLWLGLGLGTMGACAIGLVQIAAGIAVLAVPIVLKALGKNVPGLDQATPVIVGFLKKFKKAPPPEQLPENQPGLR